MTLVPELAIGELDGESEEVFGRIGSLDVDPRGRLLVLDSHAREVRVFSEDGEHLLTFGGMGGGPGEFRGPDHLRASSDGRIVVRDQGAARFSVFSGDGEYIGGWPRQSGYSTNAPFFLDTAGRVFNPSLADRLVIYSLDGIAPDTIPVPTLGYDPPRLRVASNGGVASYSIPFIPDEHWTIARDGSMVVGVSDDYAIERRLRDGGVLRIERRTEPIPVLEEEAAQARELITRRIRRGNDDPGWRWRGPDIPSTKPAFRGIQAGVDGTIWVFREALSVEEPDPDWDPDRPDAGFETRWARPVVADVFEPDGRYLGPVRFPRSVRWSYPPPILSLERVWAATAHEVGFPQVVRYRLEAN